MTITDEQIRDACNTLGLSPTGHVPVKPFVGRLAPEPGPLGFAAGHETPGWRYLRCLVDEIAKQIGEGRFAECDYDESKDLMDTVAAHRARNWPWTDALVAVADLEVDEDFEDAKTWLGNETPGLAEQAWTLLGYGGYQVCQEVFADFLSAKNQEA